MKKAGFLILTLFLLATTLAAERRGDDSMNNSGPFVFPGGGFATYKYIDRNLSINDFVNVKIGMTYKEIQGLLGEPSGIFGSGVQWPFYETHDKTYVVLYIGLEPESELFSIRIIDASGRAFELIPSGEG